jgi:hypothetical protein
VRYPADRFSPVALFRPRRLPGVQESIAAFQKEFNEQGIEWRINNHGQTKHGWALPAGVFATEYSEVADRRSTLSMMSFFAELFPGVDTNLVKCNAAGTQLNVHVAAARQTREMQEAKAGNAGGGLMHFAVGAAVGVAVCLGLSRSK